MAKVKFLDGKVTLLTGDCLDVLKTLPENSVDSVVTDPPYHLTSISKPRKDLDNYDGGKGNPYARRNAKMSGFMGKEWDGGDIAFRLELWTEVLRVLKPGGHLVSFGGTRTYHRMACAIEDAGFEIRDSIQWLYGSGFPKSLDVSKAIDKAAGAERIYRPDPRWLDKYPDGPGGSDASPMVQQAARTSGEPLQTSDAVTDAARQWSGFGTALKPACEPIMLARKPLSESTVAANVLKWGGAGALNIDGCRVAMDELAGRVWNNGSQRGHDDWRVSNGTATGNSIGRWPANVIHDGSDEVVGAFPESGPAKSGGIAGWQKDGYVGGKYEPIDRTGYDDNGGSVARFFYTAKADSDDRLGSKHPTVKPLDLMQYLVRLVTPPNGTCLDPFAGTGTTGEAAWREGMSCILIEREVEYRKDIARRMSLAKNDPIERKRVAKTPGAKPQETLF